MIHSISSTLPSFKKLTFKPGLNVLLTKKTEKATDKQTRNSAGKTSLIEIIHYLPGSSPDAKSVIRANKLDGYSFRMEFDLGKENITVVRSTSKASKIEVYDLGAVGSARQIPNTEWNDILSEKMFHLHASDTGAQPPGFRSVLNYFVRRDAAGAFDVPDKQSTMQQAGDSQLALMYLMGFDWPIARDWQVVREREKTLTELKKAAGLGAFGSIIGKSSDLRTQLTVAEARLRRLRGEVDLFQVLEEYRDLEREADMITGQLQALSNGNVVDEATTRDLEQALATESAPSLVNLEKLYQEVNIVLPEIVRKRYEDVRSFHASVVRNRRDYLTSELASVKHRIQERNQKKISLDARRSEVMSVLRSHGALDEFTSLQNESGRLAADVESLRKRFAAAELLESTKNELELERSQLELRLRRDFKEQAELLSDAILAFQRTSGMLYETAGNMEIEATRQGPMFKFSIPGDRGKGMRKMQIFCFDMMLMSICTSRGTGPGFLIHDSHLFDGVDGRQILNALRVAAKTAEELGFQYIVTMNQDDAFKEIEPGFDLNDYVVPVPLTDEIETGGLFGMRFE